MKISKNSWHYKLNNFLVDGFKWIISDGELGLCTYFWLTIWNTIVVLFLTLFSIVLLYLLVVEPIIFIVTGLLGTPLGFINPMTSIFYITFCGIISLGVGIVATMKGEMKVIRDSWKFRSQEETNEGITKITENKPSLFAEYYKAYKSKFCPIIELED